MNARIKELADEIFSMEEFEYAEEFLDEEFIKKFAELIVRECADIADNPDVDMLRVGKAIKQHFGVTE